MKFAQVILPIAALFLAFSSAHAALDEDRIVELSKIVGNNPLLNDTATKEKFLEAIAEIRARFPQCRPNVCFGLDGSGSIKESEFDFQKAFVVLATATLGGLRGSKFAAVQYGAINNIIAPLQDPSASFLFAVNANKHQKATLTLVGPAIQYCTSQMALTPAPVNKIVILGDGQTSFLDDNAFFGAQVLAANFRDASVANGIIAGLVGSGGNKRFFLDLVGGVEQRVLEAPEWSKIVDIIFAFVEQICG